MPSSSREELALTPTPDDALERTDESAATQSSRPPVVIWDRATASDLRSYGSFTLLVGLALVALVTLGMLSMRTRQVSCWNCLGRCDSLATLRTISITTHQFTCSVCLEGYGSSNAKTPKVLSCGHTFCHGCLKSMLQAFPAKGHVKLLSCPSCREIMEVAGGSASTVPKNFEIVHALVS